MDYFFDKTTESFFVEGINQIPTGAIPVAEKDYQTLIDGRSNGCKIIVNGNNLSLTPPIPGQEYIWNGSAWIVSEERKAELLARQRNEVRALINAKRDECVNGGVFVPLINKWIDTDDKGRSTLVEIKADFDINGKNSTYTLICADNTAQTINFEQFKAVWNAAKTLKEKMFENAYMHKTLLDKSNNPKDYDWSSGWVKTYREHLEGK
jgi:putative tail fiber assembly protein|nr:MAG TPA: protein of unknown function (DUF4376) [Caudoviricetes sp.]